MQAQRKGAGPVALLDTDPQGSLAEWWNVREAKEPAFMHAHVAQLSATLGRMRSLGFNLLVIDTPPAITSAIEKVVQISDMVVIPARPSPHDLRAAGATVDLVEQIGRPIVFVVNAATKGARITAEAAIALSQHGTVAPVTVHQRTDFAASMIDGRTVMELEGASRSSEEVAALWDYLTTRLGKGERRTVLPTSGSLVPRRGPLGTKSNLLSGGV